MRLEDTPSFLWFPGTDERVDYREGVMVDYRYYETVGMPVLFEFGFGLGYTTFEFGGMEVGRTEMTDKETVKVSVEVRNTGKRPGREVVQLYVGDDYSQHIRGLLDSPMDRRNPAKELRAFAKTPELKPGESTRVSFELGKRAFAHFDDSSPDKWTVGAPNKFKIMVGASVRDIRLQASIAVKSSTSRVGFSRDTPIRKFIELQDSEINALLQPAMPFNIQIATDALTGKKVSTSAEYDESLMLVASFSSMPLHKTIGWSRGKINEDMIGKVVRMAAKKVAAKL
jgi:beta-glucosidase